MATWTLDATATRCFNCAADFRAWLEQHGQSATELWVGFHTKASDRGDLTYDEAVEEALCVGRIDGVRAKPGPDVYANIFSPRAPRSAWSAWSAANLRRFETLCAVGRVTADGMRVFESRDLEASGYAIADRLTALDTAIEAALRAEPAAWTYFAAQPPAYGRDAAFWVASAKRADTREHRLATLVAESAAGRRFGAYEATATQSRTKREEH